MKTKVVLEVESVKQTKECARIYLTTRVDAPVSGCIVVRTNDPAEIAGWVSRIGKLIELVPGDM